ncbi:hypothetical protein ACFQ1M_09780 [Sungkyunkwania multivorans]|uniref:Uncharacterized protein n=1 Tax=Sungkyunkwania multivorans TaxID=1173618 RepID=A0ABW3CY82_9FLAO
MRAGVIEPILISDNKVVNFKDLYGKGVYDVSVRNIGEKDVRIMGVDIIKTDDIFRASTDMLLLNENFSVEFIDDPLTPGATQGAVLWYGIVQCE